MSNNLNNQTMSNNQILNPMNNNTTTQQEFQYTLEQAINIVKQSPSSIWRTEDVLNLISRIKVKELFIEVPTESEDDMYKSIEEQEHINGMLELIYDMDYSIEVVESSIDNIEVDDNNIELEFYGREVQVNNIEIDGKATALSDLDTLRIELKQLKAKMQELARKEVSNG